MFALFFVLTFSLGFQLFLDNRQEMANTKGKKGESAGNKKQITNEVVTREYTVNLHKRLHGVYVIIIIQEMN
jgi:hypothetical protein